MGRLQDFPTVTPTSSDNLLVVQSQGQGLASWGSKLDSANPTGTGALSLNRKANTTVADCSVAVGYNTEASGLRSFAEGHNTTASGDYSHAEGIATIASGDRSHAEGTSSTSSGLYSHAENQNTTASGQASHAEGLATIANHRSQHVFGEHNVADASTSVATSRGNYVEIVGNGANTSNRSNARTLDWSGNEVLAGGLKVNGSDNVGIASIGYNANTDRNTESNRQAAMRYLRTNCFSKGGSTGLVRYSGGYYNTYIYSGNLGTTTYGEGIVEFAHNLTSGEKIIYWTYTPSTDTFIKSFAIS